MCGLAAGMGYEGVRFYGNGCCLCLCDGCYFFRARGLRLVFKGVR